MLFPHHIPKPKSCLLVSAVLESCCLVSLDHRTNNHSFLKLCISCPSIALNLVFLEHMSSLVYVRLCTFCVLTYCVVFFFLTLWLLHWRRDHNYYDAGVYVVSVKPGSQYEAGAYVESVKHKYNY